jgi:hypothetical protein
MNHLSVLILAGAIFQIFVVFGLSAWSRWRDRCNRRDARHAAIIRTLEFRPLCTCAENAECPIHRGVRTK